METSGAEILDKDIYNYIDNNHIIGLAEMMNYPGINLNPIRHYLN